MNIRNTLKTFVEYVFPTATIQERHVAFAQCWHELSLKAKRQQLDYIESAQKLYGHDAAVDLLRFAYKYSIISDYCSARRDSAIEKSIN